MNNTICKIKRPRKKRLTAFILASAMFCSIANANVLTATEAEAASLPGRYAIASESNILELIQAYDADGSFLTRSAMESDKDFYGMLITSYFPSESVALDNLDTVAHEAFHEFAIPKYMINNDTEERIYIGNGKSVTVPFTDVFPSQEMAKSVPKRCRTATYHYRSGDRFKTYIVDKTGFQRSNVDGIYGLLNEFGGYCWGFHNNNNLYSYRDKFKDTAENWNSFVMEGESDRLAYAEFKYYMLHYMYYAKTHHPDMYRQILANEKFRKAYRLIDHRFTKEIKDYEKKLSRVENKLDNNDLSINDDTFILRKQYKTMTNEVKKKQYSSIHKQMIRY